MHTLTIDDIPFSTGIIWQGDTIAIQFYAYKRSYMGCPGTPCGKSTCPGMFITKDAWKKCWGEVFQIYRNRGIRTKGPGYALKVGDTVGIYYPRGKKWFSCVGRFCTATATCPGKPTDMYGFNSQALWKRCWGEVFEIYARGKKRGSYISPNDTIMLYYPRDKKYLSLSAKHPSKHPCPGPPPPSLDKYNRCWGEVLEIVTRN